MTLLSRSAQYACHDRSSYEQPRHPVSHPDLIDVKRSRTPLCECTMGDIFPEHPALPLDLLPLIVEHLVRSQAQATLAIFCRLDKSTRAEVDHRCTIRSASPRLNRSLHSSPYSALPCPATLHPHTSKTPTTSRSSSMTPTSSTELSQRPLAIHSVHVQTIPPAHMAYSHDSKHYTSQPIPPKNPS